MPSSRTFGRKDAEHPYLGNGPVHSSPYRPVLARVDEECLIAVFGYFPFLTSSPSCFFVQLQLLFSPF
jgi:hypothetical protein